MIEDGNDPWKTAREVFRNKRKRKIKFKPKEKKDIG